MSDDVNDIRTKVQALMAQAQADLAQMVSYESVFAPADNPPADCNKMVVWLAKAFTAAGFTDIAVHVTSDKSKTVTGYKKGPPGAPTVLLYFHHDVQPVPNRAEWNTDPWTLTPQNDGRWYGRGAADCKGNIAVHLTAIRALGDDLPVNLKIVGEGSEEQGTGGLEDFVADPSNHDLLAADAILVGDAGNFADGTPTLTTSLRGVANVIVAVDTLEGPMHSGQFGGPSPDALAALISMLATLRDAKGNTTVRGLDNSMTWSGQQYPPDQFRTDARVLDGVDLLGSGTVSDMLWARLAVTVCGIDCPSVDEATPAVQGHARALVSLRIPPGMTAEAAQHALMNHLKSVAPWNARVTLTPSASGEPFRTSTSGPGYNAMVAAMGAAYGKEVVAMGQGASIPLCNVFQTSFPKAEIMLFGVEEPKALIHAPNESVDPSEIENMAVSLAVFLQKFAKATG
ncbi:dipeptidase [Polyangium sorediatum]|uniref:Dipeptidase n=1 Tax=Polyangium sorediatum TaxID=889274 RepID=A0ABT6NR73_9BACT|nr:dipeptidase [Polyangium sorediatum]MDI1430837.1 dipeptidase [Polyangium sorediatum]